MGQWSGTCTNLNNGVVLVMSEAWTNLSQPTVEAQPFPS